MKPAKIVAAILAACLVAGLLPGAGLAQSAPPDGPSPALVAAANAYKAVSAQLDDWLAENKSLVATGKQLADQLAQMEAGTPRQWVRARGAAARTVYDQQIRRLQAEMRDALIRLGTLPRGSAEAAALQARVKAIDSEITAAARAMGVIKREEERLRVFASRLAAATAQESAAVDQVNNSIIASNAAIAAVRAAVAAKDDAGATNAYHQATSRLQAAVRDGPQAHQYSRRIIELLRAEIAARGGPAPEPPPDSYGGGDSAEGPETPVEPPGPSPAEAAAAAQTLQLHQQLQDERQLIADQQLEEEKLRQEIRAQLKADTVTAVKDYRDEMRSLYNKEIAPQQERLQAIQDQVKTLAPNSDEARRLQTEAQLIRTRVREYTQSLDNQKAVLDRLTRDLEMQRAPIRKLQEAQRRVEAEIRAELSRLRDAEKAIRDNWQAGEAAVAAGDRAARTAALERIAQAMEIAINARDRYKLKQAELVSILATQNVLLRTGQAGP